MLRIALIGLIVVGIGSPAWADDVDDCNAKRGDAALAACDRIITTGASTREQRGAAHINRGQQLYELQQYDRAIEDFTAAIALKPKRLAMAFSNRGNAYYMTGDAKAAIENYTRAVDVDSDYAAAFTARGLLHEKSGNLKKARADYDAALEADATFGDTKWAQDTARAAIKRLKSE
jgi:tetratricopeptide (TPR) repeat protein